MIKTVTLTLGAALCAGICSATTQPVSDWRTPAEISGYRTTPDYADTVAYLKRLAAVEPGVVKIENFGETGEGRELKIVIASKDGVFDPVAIHSSGRAILLVQNSIHAGEMDGKDACMALLRDIVLNQNGAKRLLDHVVLVFIPVYNIDGHERRSAYNRINQNGPEEMGWRANGTNLNLNRDYMKADAPETRAFLKMFHRWLPDFFVDDHVTDGMDYQYDVTFAIDETPDVAPATARWLHETVTPELAARVNATGHLAFPSLIDLKEETDPTQGLTLFVNPPRFSTGLMILEDRPGLLVELHMLKDYKTRVTGNYELLRALMSLMNRDASKLIALNRAADEAASRLGSQPGQPFALALAASGATTPVDFKGFQFTRTRSEISGATDIAYVHEPWNTTLPIETGTKVTAFTIPPVGYIIPREWTSVIDVLAAHDVIMHRTTEEWTGKVGRYRCSGMQWQARPYEGRHPIVSGEFGPAQRSRFGQCVLSTEAMTFPAESVVVVLNQRQSKVAIHWLEPEAPDSALRWGFFDSVFEQKEYGESYVLERLAREMLAKDSGLKAEFDHRLQSDAQFAANPWARLEFFYEHSPWYTANHIGEYPVGRLISLDGLPMGN